MQANDVAISCEDAEALLAAYALGTADATLRTTIESHLRACPACRQTLTAYRATAQVLPFGLSEATPAHALRARVLDAVEAAANGRTAPRRTALSPWTARLGGLRWWQALGALILLVSLACNAVLYQSLNAEKNLIDEQTTAIATLLQNASVERRQLAAASPAPDARGTLLLARDQQTVALVVQQMPVLPSNRVYQVWLTQHGQRTSGGTFTVAPDGCGMFIVQTPQALNAYDGVGVTVEPAGGSLAPTSPRVIGASLADIQPT